jgi:hypothetical protein
LGRADRGNDLGKEFSMATMLQPTASVAPRFETLRPATNDDGKALNRLVSSDGELEANVKEMVWTYFSSAEVEWVLVKFLVVKVWTFGICNHYVIDTRDGALLVSTRERRERESWSMAKKLLAARGYLGQEFVAK